MKKKIIAGGAAAGLILIGAASAATLDTSAVGSPTLAGGEVTVDGAVLKRLSFGTAWAQDFSKDSAGIVTDDGYGTITVGADGQAVVNGTGATGPFTRFGGYTSTATAPWTASVEVYLDPANPTQFDYSVAANGASGHIQDFVFHSTTKPGTLTVGVGTGSSWKLPNRQPASVTDGFKIQEAGWYTLQHTFRPNAEGNLEVEMALVQKGVTLWSKVIEAKQSGSSVPFAQTGHRYGWFTFTDGDLKIDNLILDSAEPQRQIDTITVEVDKPNSSIVASFGGFTSTKVQANEAGIAVIDVPGMAVEAVDGPIHLVVTR